MTSRELDYQALLQRVQALEVQNRTSDAQNHSNDMELKQFLLFIFDAQRIATQNLCTRLINDGNNEYKIFDNERLTFANVYGRVKVLESIQQKLVNMKFDYSQWSLLLMRHMDGQLLNLLPSELASNINGSSYLDIVKYLVADIDFIRLHQMLALSIMNWRPKLGVTVKDNIHTLITAGTQVKKFTLNQAIRVKIFDLLDYYVPLWDFKSFTFEALKWSEIHRFVHDMNLSNLVVQEDYLKHLDNIGKNIPKEFNLLGIDNPMDSSVISPYSSINVNQDHSVMAVNPWMRSIDRSNRGNHAGTSSFRGNSFRNNAFRGRGNSYSQRGGMNRTFKNNYQNKSSGYANQRYWCKSCNCESCVKHQKGYNDYVQRRKSGRVNVIAVEASGEPIVYIESPYCQNSSSDEVYFVDSNTDQAVDFQEEEFEHDSYQSVMVVDEEGEAIESTDFYENLKSLNCINDQLQELNSNQYRPTYNLH